MGGDVRPPAALVMKICGRVSVCVCVERAHIGGGGRLRGVGAWHGARVRVRGVRSCLGPCCSCQRRLFGHRMGHAAHPMPSKALLPIAAERRWAAALRTAPGDWGKAAVGVTPTQAARG